jgi:DNA-binding transcriptional LysR family regulator
VRTGHPLTGRPAPTAADYAAGEHITVSRRGSLANPLDDALARLGLTRHVVASAPTEAAALAFVRASDLLVTVPESTLGPALADLGLTVLSLPLELPPAQVYLSWHQRYDTDRAHAWLRALARTALAAPAGAPQPPG